MTAPKMSTARAYDVLAPAYDLLTNGYAYGPWLAAIDRLATEHGLPVRRALDGHHVAARGALGEHGVPARGALGEHGVPARWALDVACGTGKSLAALLDLGYMAVGCDGSEGMAAVARRKLAGRADVHVADMCSLPVYGRFDLVTCLDDALNHLPSAADVVRALRGMAANLAEGGLVAFDVNTLSAYRDVGDRIVEDGERIVLWHGGPARLDAPGGRAEVAMDVLSRRGDGLWRRTSASWGHWHYPLASIPGLAAAAGLEVVAVRGQRTGGVLEADADEERHPKAVFLARRARPGTPAGPHDERRDDALAAVET
jgi:SAM-dependent methyltransferase